MFWMRLGLSSCFCLFVCFVFTHSTCHKHFLYKIKLCDLILTALYHVKKIVLTGMRFLEANHR